MRIEIYLDTLYMMNFIIHLWILFLIRRRFALPVREIRVWIAAATGTTVYIILFLTAVNSHLPGIEFAAMIASVLTLAFILLPGRKRYLWKKVILYGFLCSFVISGVLKAVFTKWRLFSGREITVWAVLAGIYACIKAGEFLMGKWKNRKKQSICRAVIKSAGVKTKVTALLDTGNSLLEPISGKPVCLIEEELLARITLENTLFYRAIPFKSVGCEHGILYGVEIPKLTIYKDEECFVLEQVVCAGVPHQLSHKKAYRMILHPDLFREEFCKPLS